MTIKSIKITNVIWDKRPKTKFLIVEGIAQVQSFTDTVIIKVSEPQGINQNILLLDANIVSNQGPIKPQPVPFYFKIMTNGDEPWTHVQISDGNSNDMSPITILSWNGSPENPDNDTKGYEAKNYGEPISALIGKVARIYTSGDSYTDDYRPERANIELDVEGNIVDIWFG